MSEKALGFALVEETATIATNPRTLRFGCRIRFRFDLGQKTVDAAPLRTEPCEAAQLVHGHAASRRLEIRPSLGRACRLRANVVDTLC